MTDESDDAGDVVASAVSVVKLLCFVGKISCECDASGKGQEGNEGGDNGDAAGHRRMRIESNSFVVKNFMLTEPWGGLRLAT